MRKHPAQRLASIVRACRCLFACVLSFVMARMGPAGTVLVPLPVMAATLDPAKLHMGPGDCASPGNVTGCGNMPNLVNGGNLVTIYPEPERGKAPRRAATLDPRRAERYDEPVPGEPDWYYHIHKSFPGRDTRDGVLRVCSGGNVRAQGPDKRRHRLLRAFRRGERV